MNGIRDLTGELRELPSTCYHMRAQIEGAIYEPGSGLSPSIKSAGALILYLPSRAIRNKFQLFKLLRIWYFCHSSLNELRKYGNTDSMEHIVLAHK